MDIIEEVRARFRTHAVYGSSAWVWAWRDAINQCVKEGLIVAPPEWDGARKVTLLPAGSIRCVNIKLNITGGNDNA